MRFARMLIYLLTILSLSRLQDCQLSVVKPNPRQYVARISQMPGVEVWFQVRCSFWCSLGWADGSRRPCVWQQRAEAGAHVLSAAGSARGFRALPRPPPCTRQRASDVVRKLVYGDIDLGIVGYDMLAEIGDSDPGE